MVSSGGKLDALQLRVLETLAGVHLGHRKTRDLDLFWRMRAELGDLPRIVQQRLTGIGLTVATLQTTPSFVRLQVTDGEATVRVDLISEPMDAVDGAECHKVGEEEIFVDSRRAILAEKLCALLERSELRDLVDVEALVRSGESLDIAIADAPRRDRGFSALTLAWVLRDFNVSKLANASGLSTDMPRIEAFREELIETLIRPNR